MPKRSAIGMDYNRLNLLVAVLEKRLGLKLFTQDIYLNIAGGIKVTEPAADAAVVAAILSSYRNKPVDKHTVFFGEIGLSGEIRTVSFMEKRVREAEKLGFKRIVLPNRGVAGAEGNASDKGVEIIGIANVSDLFNNLCIF
jgi:DNA repair protein RadA/Sms